MDLLLLIFLMLDIRCLCAFYCLFIMTVSRIVRNIVNDGSNDIAILVFFWLLTKFVDKFFFSLETRSNKFNSIVNASDRFKKWPMNSYRKFANWHFVIFANIKLTNGFYCHIFFILKKQAKLFLYTIHIIFLVGLVPRI